VTKPHFADLLYTGFWSALDWLYPPVCAGCERPGYQICPACLAQIRWLDGLGCPQCGSPGDGAVLCPDCRRDPPEYQALRSLARYEGILRRCIHALKYENNQGLGLFCAAWMKARLRGLNWPIALVIPVPLSPDRLASRGYNQSALLARPVAYHFGWAFAPHGLIRSRNTRSQVELSSAERRANVAGAFQAEPLVVRGKHILLIDDVTTTGATIRECTKALLSEGAAGVFCLTLARPLQDD